jgi:hypothetical protein
LPLDIFWISSKEEYPEIARRAVVILMQFSAPHLHEDEVRVSLSHTCLPISEIIKKHQ